MPAASHPDVSPSSWLSTWWLKRAMATTRPFARGALLDVGCGDAPYRGYYDVQHHWTCDWPRTQHGRSRIDVFADAAALPFDANRFDTVLCTEVLEHLRDPSAAVAEFSRVLRPGGRLILSVPFLYSIHEQPIDYFRFTEHGLRELLRARELEPIHLVRRGGAVSVVADLSAKLGNRVMRNAMRSARIPRAIEAVVQRVAVVAPQQVLATVVDVAEARLPRLGGALNAGQAATLGYVVVAERR